MSAAIFDGIAAGLKADPTIAKKANGVFQFNLSKPASEWVVDCKAATVTPGKAAKADVTLTLSDADFVAMAAGKLNGMQAFMSGKLKIKVRASAAVAVQPAPAPRSPLTHASTHRSAGQHGARAKVWRAHRRREEARRQGGACCRRACSVVVRRRRRRPGRVCVDGHLRDDRRRAEGEPGGGEEGARRPSAIRLRANSFGARNLSAVLRSTSLR